MQTDIQSCADPAQRAARRRSPSVLFENGVAVGWAFEVREAFRAALDILYTVRKNEALFTEGAPPAYAFRTGDSIPSIEKTGSAPTNSRWHLQVIIATPDQLRARRLIPGLVEFRCLEWENGRYIERFTRTVSQAEFVEILRTGF